MNTSKPIQYGPHREHVADLMTPARRRARGPAVVLLHGGYWKARYRRDLMQALMVDLAASDYVVLNLEYRRVGNDGGGGGFRKTLRDVGRGIDYLAVQANVDPGRVYVVGHSAGGQLALWACARHRFQSAFGIAPRINPRAALALAPVTDLSEALELGLGEGAVASFLGGSKGTQARRLRAASPIELLPLGVRQLVVHGTRDRTVPVGMSRRYVERARAAGDAVDFLETPGGHMGLIDPLSPPWRAAKRFLQSCSADAPSRIS